MVWANCFCWISISPNWKTKIVDADLASDGGDCYLRGTINLTTKKFGMLEKNGYG